MSAAFTSQESATKISAGDGITAEEIAARGATASEDVARYALILGDDSLILAQRLGHWISRAPELEEDVALGNIALDLLGHARFLLTYAASAWDKTEDDFAYFRDEEEFRSCRLVEQPNGDFAVTIARQLIFGCYSHTLYSSLLESTDTTLAAIAEKAVKEVEYHVDHAYQWLLRLGGGTEESHRRMQEGLDSRWTYLEELFYDAEPTPALAEAGVAVLPSSLRTTVLDQLERAITEAGLEVPQISGAYGGDRSGRFSEHRSYILSEMQSLARQYPGATW